MKYSRFTRTAAAALSLALLIPQAAQALTPEQCAALLEEFYVDEVPSSVLEQTTVEGMIDALGDPYTTYFTPEEYEAFTASMSDTSLVGIGVVLSFTEEGLLVEEVLSGSPAESGGLKAGDLITAVDSLATAGVDSNIVTGWIQGKEGTTVSITYRREGQEHTVSLLRALVVIPATTSQLLDDHIGYISCTSFGEETVAHFREALETYKDSATAWIVDLRSNPGGRTDAATDAAALFTGEGQMLYLRNGADQYAAYTCEEPSATLYPVIVLVDQSSASASEIFAAAIRDRGAGIVVGTRTFGKGVAQTVLDQESLPELFPEGDAIKITSHRSFSPAGNTADQVGIIPDLLVPSDQTLDVARLLAGSSPTTSTKGYLRLDLYWRWYVELDTAKAESKAFQTLLEAIPVNKKVWLGVSGIQWQLSSPEEVAQVTGTPYEPDLFPDQEESDYETALQILKQFGLIHGKDDGLFHPKEKLTRAELCQMLAEALNCTVPTNSCPFTDVPTDAWYARAVTAMSNMGLVMGAGDGTFRPEDPVDHQQLITILARLIQRLNLSFYDCAKNAGEEVCNIVGVMNYAGWAKKSAWLLSYSQKNYLGAPITLLWDFAHDIDPTAHTTREEAAYALYRILSYIEVLPA